MELYSDSGELFLLRQQFYAGQYKKVAETPLSSFTEEYLSKAEEYVLRSKISLGLLEEVLSYIEEQDQNVSLETIKAYALYLDGDSHGNSQLEELIEIEPKEEIVQILGAIYLVNQGSIAEALTLLSNQENSLESIALTVQLKAFDKQDEAVKELKNAKVWSQDDIVYNLAEAWLNATQNSENIQSSFYFFEEITSSNQSIKNLIGLLVLNLQLHHLPESEEIIAQCSEYLAQNGDNSKDDLLANQIVFDILTNGGKNGEQLRGELAGVNENHAALVDYNEKVGLFDEVVAKYAEQVKY